MTLQQILKLSKVSGWIWLLPEAFQSEAERIHDVWMDYITKCIKNRHQELKKVREKINVWKSDPELAEFAKAARLRYLRGQLKGALKEFNLNRQEWIEFVRVWRSDEEKAPFIKRQESLDKKIKGYETSIAVLEGKIEQKDLITEEMIERAREYPIENLMEIGFNRRAKCVFHQGEGWNMDIRKNFAHCYVCGASGDTINVYRAINNGASFREAVLALQ